LIVCIAFELLAAAILVARGRSSWRPATADG
jgi:hypothetical protein